MSSSITFDYEIFLNRSICFRDRTQIVTTTAGQSGPESYGNEEVLPAP